MDTGIKVRSITLSILIHAALILLMLFMVLHTPNPPFPDAGGGGGVLVNIGYLEAASGDVQPMSELTSSQPQPEEVKQAPAPQPDEQLISQDDERTAMADIKEKKTETVKPIVKPKETTTVKPKETPKPVVKTADPLAMYKGKNTNSTSQGTAQSGKGDQGAKDGDPFSNYYGKSGTGPGSGGGDGPGHGPGTGPGTGPGSGPGISYNLNGRAPLKRIKPEDTSQEEGVVVVAITVDKDGHISNANPGVQGSTTTSTSLYNKAKQAALKWEFNKSSDGTETQKGTITFVFKNR